MQLSLFGVISIFLFHGLALVLLCPSKYKPIKAAGVWCGMIGILTMVTFLLYRIFQGDRGLFLAMGVTVVIAVLTALWLSSYDVSKTLFLFLTYSHVFMVIVYISRFVSLYFFDGSQTVMIVVRILMHFCLVVFCILGVRKKFSALSGDITKGWWPLNLVVLLLFLNMSGMAIRAMSADYVDAEVLSFFLMLFITAAVYWLFFNTIRYMSVSRKTERIEMQSDYLMQQVSDMQESIENAKRIRHDARHHNMQIAQYAEKGELDVLLRYLGEYEKDAESHGTLTLCENVAADNILNAYTKKAKQQGIDVRLNIELASEVKISDIDLVAMLANLMENAIHGCINSGEPHPFIDLYIGRKASKLIIYIQNTAGCGVILENGLPKAKDGKGIGVSSILHSASKYGGEYDFKVEDGLFSCRLLLKASKSIASVF